MDYFKDYLDMEVTAPYPDNEGAVRDILALVDAMCYGAFTIRDLWGERLEMRGVVITPQEFQEAVLPPGSSRVENDRKGMGQELLAMFRHVADRGRKSSDTEPEIRVWHICRKFELTDWELLCLFLAAALEYDRKYERIFGYLQDNVGEKQPTLGLAISFRDFLWGDERDEGEDCRRELMFSGILKGGVILEKVSRLSRPLVLGDGVFSYLSGGKWIGGAWVECLAEESGGEEKRLAVTCGYLEQRKSQESCFLQSAAGEIAVTAKGLGLKQILLRISLSESEKEEGVGPYLLSLLSGRGFEVEMDTAKDGEERLAFGVPVRTVYTWNDLVLEEESRQLLVQILNQVRYRDTVREQWGFGKKDPYGNGISALFYGPPGTGKTMAAQVIAGELGMKLYKVDVSRLVSKYIGETEKHVSALFGAARKNGAVLFFDEADGLFAKRSQVGNSNDRYANMETGFLLQKLEEYDGVSVLATNYANNIDDAFKRRIRFLVRFPFPSQEMRSLLWKQMFPQQAVVEEPILFEGLAHRFELSGSSIREVTLQSAYLAAASGRGIRNQDILEALRIYYQKHGKHMTAKELDWR